MILLREWETGNETSTQFISPWLLQVWRGFAPPLKPISEHPLARDFTWSDWPAAKEARGEGPGPWEGPVSLRAMAEEAVRRETILRRRLDEIQSQIDDEVYRLYEISAEDRRLIEAELAETATADEAEKQEEFGWEQRRKHGSRQLNYAQRDGTHPSPAALRRSPGLEKR